MLIYLAMVVVAYACYLVGKALWARAVGASWLIVPALLVYLGGFWLLLAAATATRGAALLAWPAVWAGLWLGKRLGRSHKGPPRLTSDSIAEELKDRS